MLKQKDSLGQAIRFNSGTVRALKEKDGEIVDNASLPIPFGYRTIGMNRRYKAMQADIDIRAYISIPYGCGLESAKLVELCDARTGEKSILYVSAADLKEYGAPPHILLTLTESTVDYEDLR